jgi:phage baseplate assembly protein W
MISKSLVGVKYPFSIGGGSVTTTSNPVEMAGSQITFCLGTMVGERVMRPDWGLDIMNSVFAMGGDMDSVMREAVEDAFRRWFPDYRLKEVSSSVDEQNPATVYLRVRYGTYEDSSQDTTVRVGVQIPSGSEIFNNEGAF